MEVRAITGLDKGKEGVEEGGGVGMGRAMGKCSFDV